MENKSFIVLRECRFFLKILNLTNKTGIYFDLCKISNWFFYFLYLFPASLWLIFSIWFCIDNDFNLKAIIWPLNLMAAVVQMFPILLFLISKKNLLIEIMDRLQVLINKSKWIITKI